MLSTVPGYQRFFLAGVSSPLEVSSLAMEWKGIPVQEQAVNQFHRLGLFPVDDQIPVGPRS